MYNVAMLKLLKLSWSNAVTHHSNNYIQHVSHDLYRSLPWAGRRGRRQEVHGS